MRISLQEHEGQSPFCNCVDFMPDGKSLVTGWTDGKIRAFTPQSGRLLFIIRDGHRPVINNAASSVSGISMANKYASLVPQGVTCMSPSIDCNYLLTGGFDGEVKLWQIGKQTQTLCTSQRMHRAPITAIQYMQSGEQAISSAIDGSIILWDMQMPRGQKPLQKILQMDSPPSKAMDGSIVTGIISMSYNEVLRQLVTLGLDRRVTYWNLETGKVIKQL